MSHEGVQSAQGQIVIHRRLHLVIFGNFIKYVAKQQNTVPTKGAKRIICMKGQVHSVILDISRIARKARHPRRRVDRAFADQVQPRLNIVLQRRAELVIMGRKIYPKVQDMDLFPAQIGIGWIDNTGIDGAKIIRYRIHIRRSISRNRPVDISVIAIRNPQLQKRQRLRNLRSFVESLLRKVP